MAIRPQTSIEKVQYAIDSLFLLEETIFGRDGCDVGVTVAVASSGLKEVLRELKGEPPHPDKQWRTVSAR